MNTKDPKLTVLQFNEYINRQDIKGLNSLMTEDHTFIDRTDKATKGKDMMIKGWLEFFRTYPQYKNHFTRVDSKDDLVIIIGYAYWSKKEPHDQMIWTARIKNDRVAEWRIYEDTKKNRKKFKIR
jgi:predicted SnoaL-like aldol condensation-catalyzing enzyme